MSAKPGTADLYLAGRHVQGTVGLTPEHCAQTILNHPRRGQLGAYGVEYIIDLYGCDARQFTAVAVRMFMRRVCRILRLEPADFHLWCYDDPREKAAAPPYLKGVSAVQFITTSNVTLHCLDDLGLACVNIFTCGTIQHADIARVRDFCVGWFHARDFHEHLLNRG